MSKRSTTPGTTQRLTTWIHHASAAAAQKLTNGASATQAFVAHWFTTRQGLKKTGALLAVAAVAGLIGWARMIGAENLVGDDLCPINRPVEGHVVVIVDRTDDFTADEKDYLKRLFDWARSQVKRFHRLSVVSIDATNQPSFESSPIIHYSMCNPGRGAEAHIGYENPRLLEEKFVNGYMATINRLQTQLINDTGADNSPIMETIVATAKWARTVEPDVPATTILIVSDMLEHVTEYSHYKVKGGTYWASVPEDMLPPSYDTLRGFDVYVAYLNRRRNARYRAEHQDFWRKYLRHTGARATVLNAVTLSEKVDDD